MAQRRGSSKVGSPLMASSDGAGSPHSVASQARPKRLARMALKPRKPGVASVTRPSSQVRAKLPRASVPRSTQVM